MIVLRRISTVPTIPELMRAEFEAWSTPVARALLAAAWHRRVGLSGMRACLVGAALVLMAARMLLRLGLVTPACAAGAFQLATRLTRTGLDIWRSAGP
jgi:hypothetical protein